jgi:hypothetical protein
VTALECVTRERSLTKGRRLSMRVNRWRDADWYAAWSPSGGIGPSIADEWEHAAAYLLGAKK